MAIHVLLLVAFLGAGLLISRGQAENVRAAVITGHAKAKDGDSVLIGLGRDMVDVRLHGIDAPELDSRAAASGALAIAP